MTKIEIYRKAKLQGIYIGNCVSLNAEFVNNQLETAKKGNQKKINAIAYKLGIINKEELKLYNPYHHKINNEYIIYIHSAIEYFIKYN